MVDHSELRGAVRSTGGSRWCDLMNIRFLADPISLSATVIALRPFLKIITIGFKEQ